MTATSPAPRDGLLERSDDAPTYRKTSQHGSPITHACDPEPSGDVSGTPTSTAPAQQPKSRLVGIDATRGLAMLLIMAAHVLPFSGADGEPTNIYLLGGYGAAAFVFLAGVGVALSTGGSTPVSSGRLAEQTVVLVVRAFAIAALGLALGYVVEYGEHAVVVLTSYGLMFLLAVLLVRLTARGAAVTAVLIGLVVPVLVHLTWGQLPTVQLVNPTFGDVVSDPLGWLVEVSVKGVYPALPWMAYFCAGIAVGRLRQLDSRRTALRLVAGGLVLAVVGKLISWMLLGPLGGMAALEQAGTENLEDRLAWGPGYQLPRSSWWWLATDAPYSATPLELLQTVGVTLAGLGLVLLLARAAENQLLSLAAVGSMTLTLYVLHLLVLSLSGLPWGSLEVWVIHTVMVVVVATAWLMRFRRGPLEFLVGTLAAKAQGAVLRRPVGRQAAGIGGSRPDGQVPAAGPRR
jgi:uncharacterized membrane protein